ncbi:histidine kinase dimerization/phospho-acceptor domain-containing protein [Novosphingobium sp.]|uniref:histidine kinase dimerization/phospho-acceptor domain-containing protein n=1 Tax=Novosphingobium sp. TaxID=1874826 RepID=UPI00286D082A|nr:histidine kinase dimerization/phospho-acceptor domain-containing protein [Novosphingobium sp.]
MGMQFDDRLATVLRMRADSAAVRRIQLRQLVDLLGTCPSTAYGPSIDAAYVRLSDLQRDLPPVKGAELLRDPALRLRSPRLVAALAGGDPRLAEAALQRADLSEEQWLDLIPALPPEARQALHQRADLAPVLRGLLIRLGVRGRGLPPAQTAAAAAPVIEPVGTAAATRDPAPPLANDDVFIPDDGNARGERIGAIVKRIEAYRKAKQVIEHAHGDAPRLPLGEEHVLSISGPVRACDFATDSNGRIVWSDAGVAPMLVGRRLGEDGGVARLIRRQQPLCQQLITLAGAEAIAGRWQIDAMPWFDPLGGRFMGYRGRLRRPAATQAEITSVTLPDSEADRVRQMLHELRTPVNAIQIGAEIIQQQLYGPSPHEYRALAATIAGDAAKILAAFEELERLAKLDSGAIELESGETDLAAVIAATAAQLGAHTKARGSGFDIKLETAAALVPLAPLELERVVWRLLATLAGTSAPGERLKLRLRDKGGAVRLDLALPASLAKLDGKALFGAGPGAVPQVIAAGMFGAGFALRLARAEAQAAGGDLKRKDDRLRLSLPGLTKAGPGHTDADEGSDLNAA